MDADESVTSYVDGELDGEALAAFERRLAADPALQAEVTRHHRLRRRLSATFDPVLHEPVPLRLDLAARAANTRQVRWRAPQWAAMAACLLAGVVIGRAALAPVGPLTERDGALVARGALGAALEEGLASEPGPIRIGVTFRDDGGRWCRTFESAPDRLAGLACRKSGRWTAEAIAAWTPGPHDRYRTAGSETPASVLAAVDASISGSPVDAVAERAARDRGWKD